MSIDTLQASGLCVCERVTVTMKCVLFSLLVTWTLAASGVEQDSPCPPQWLLFGHRCFAFYPVWSSWSTAHSLCSQTGGDFVSLHSPEELQFIRQLTNSPVWLGGYLPQQNDSFALRIRDRTNQMQEKSMVGRACIEMDPKSGELHRASCEELRFYICCSRAHSGSTVFTRSRKPAAPGVLRGVNLFSVMWGHTDMLTEGILHWSPFLRQLRSGHLTKSCYTSFVQQEALYLHRISSTLEALISGLQEADNTRSLLLHTLKHYRHRNKSLVVSPLPQWLLYSLQSFHLVVLEEPIYWLVALSARASLYSYLLEKLPLPKPGPNPQLVSKSVANTLYQEWKYEVTWTLRYQKVIKEQQDQVNVFKAISIFREHMMNQKSFFKAVTCNTEGDG
ncbi:uncharacterized protein LOC113139745 isoform X2 [Mastacembelus armatus]|uniref:uncharacterized protein LOC113139745 isoform X2 n=1 Tax=Mastacembelus armatus TaxID=205130 RepID=UPI000E45B4E0|nr:uncharacterized protein LOC113139745 isoform X2 [Mastacembelus armatus]